MTKESGTDAAQEAATAGAPNDQKPIVVAVLYSDDKSQILLDDKTLERAGITAAQALGALLFHIADGLRKVDEAADRQARSAVAPNPVPSKE